jgi:hypothetical protein
MPFSKEEETPVSFEITIRIVRNNNLLRENQNKSTHALTAILLIIGFSLAVLTRRRMSIPAGKEKQA